jgi:GTP-binding protein Era
MVPNSDPADSPQGGAARCGFVAVIGAPNAGKSTLVNALVGAKVSIVTRKVQTTRAPVRGVLTEGASQLVFTDTPGIFEPRRRLDRAMVEAAWAGAVDADIVLALVDAAQGRTEEVDRILSGLPGVKGGKVLVLNKIDRVEKPELLALADELAPRAGFTDVFMISALTGDGLEELRVELARRFDDRWERVRLLVPYEEGGRLSELYALGTPIEKRKDTEHGVLVIARLPRRDLPRFASFLIADPSATHRETA